MKKNIKYILLLGLVWSLASCSIFKKKDAISSDAKGVVLNDTISLPSGLKYIVTSKGRGIKAEKGDKIQVHYKGYLANGKVFDSSYKRHQPFSFELGQGRVIKAWEEGFSHLHQGDKAVIISPPHLAYGNRNMGDIPPNSTLTFEVELLSVKKPIKIEPFNVKGKDTITTASGLKYIVAKHIKNSSKVKKGDLVTVHYTGYLSNGSIFDSSVKRGQPIKFTAGVGQVIKGWDEALILMHSGDKYRLLIPSELAYGSRNVGSIPANSDLTFDVELIHSQTPVKIEPYNTEGKDTITTASGLKMIPIKTTSERQPEVGDMLEVHYSGYLPNDQMFDSSVKRGQPFNFQVGLGKVIKGWEEAFLNMHEGEKYRIIVPPHLAYGERGAGKVIPPNATLIFDVNLFRIKK